MSELKKVSFTLHAEQNDTGSQLVLQIENDPPIVLLEYERKLLDRSDNVSVIHLASSGTQKVNFFTGIHITVQDDPFLPLPPQHDADNAKAPA